MLAKGYSVKPFARPIQVAHLLVAVTCAGVGAGCQGAAPEPSEELRCAERRAHRRQPWRDEPRRDEPRRVEPRWDEPRRRKPGGNNLGGVNLAGNNLGGTNLGGNNLGGNNLGGTNLGGINLGGTNLGGANLGGVEPRRLEPRWLQSRRDQPRGQQHRGNEPRGSQPEHGQRRDQHSQPRRGEGDAQLRGRPLDPADGLVHGDGHRLDGDGQAPSSERLDHLDARRASSSFPGERPRRAAGPLRSPPGKPSSGATAPIARSSSWLPPRRPSPASPAS